MKYLQRYKTKKTLMQIGWESPQEAGVCLHFSLSLLLHDQSTETSRMSHILSSIRAFTKWMVTEAVTKSVPRYCSTVDLNIFSYILRDKTVIKIIKYNAAFIVVLFPFYKR